MFKSSTVGEILRKPGFRRKNSKKNFNHAEFFFYLSIVQLNAKCTTSIDQRGCMNE